MANSFWNFVTQLVPNNLAKAEDVNTNLAGISAGLDLVEAQTVSSIKVTNAPGVINISATPANRANKIISFDGAGGVLATIFIGNYRNNHVAVAGTVYNVRDTVKDSTGAIGQDNIYICNTTHTSTGTLAVDVANWDILVDVAAVAASAAAALVSENNAAASFTSFDNRYLGAKAADPTLDNSGGALIDGATYFDTTLNRMKVYDLGTTTWLLTTANAVDVAITDAGSLITAIEVEGALQESFGLITDLNHIQASIVTAGTATAYTATLGITALVVGDVYKVRVHTANTGAATLTLDATATTAIFLNDALALTTSNLTANMVAYFLWNGTNFILLNPSYVNSTYVPALTASLGGILFATANDTLAYSIDKGICHVSGGLEISFASAPVGHITMTLPVTPAALVGFADQPASEVAFQNLGTAAALGLVSILDGAGITNIYEKTSTGIASTSANRIQVNTILSFDFSYRVR